MRAIFTFFLVFSDFLHFCGFFNEVSYGKYKVSYGKKKESLQQVMTIR